MKKTLDFNKLAKAHKAKKAWEKLQEEKSLNNSDSKINQDTSDSASKSSPAIRKSS